MCINVFPPSVCMHTTCMLAAYKVQKTVLNTLDPELQVWIPKWIVGTDLRFSAKAACTLAHCVTFHPQISSSTSISYKNCGSLLTLLCISVCLRKRKYKYKYKYILGFKPRAFVPTKCVFYWASFQLLSLCYNYKILGLNKATLPQYQ
jgi:hypothetical protein